MKVLVLILLLLPVLSPAAEKFPQVLREGQFAQVVYLDLNRLSNGFFRSQLRVRFSQKLRSPDSVKVFSEHSTDDLGVDRENTYAVIEGSPISEQTVQIAETDGYGVALRTLYDERSSVRRTTALPAGKYDFFPAPLVKLSTPVGGVSAQLTDSSGKRFLLTLDTALQPAFFVEPQKLDIVQIADPAVEVNVSLAFLDGEKTYSDGPVFRAREQAVPETEAKFGHCRGAGETVEVSPLEFGPDLRSERVEYCYPVSGGFEPVVLIRKNPPHEPPENAARNLEAAKTKGGRLAQNPMVRLASSSYANCHGYALLAILGPKALPKDAYWIQAQDPATYSLGTDPLAVILKEKFRKAFSVTSSYYDDKVETALARDSRLKPGDLLVFSGARGKAHSAVVKKSPNGKTLWVENKFEEGPVIEMPIAAVHDLIPNLYDEIIVYRRR